MKILVTAGELQKLISPEVELELVSTAAAQVAGHLVDKVKAKMPNHLQTVERAIEQQIKALASPNGLHSSVKNMVSTHVSEVAQGCAVALKDKLARDATDVALVRVDELTKARLEVFDKKLHEMLAEAVNVFETALESRVAILAEQKFMALVRGASAVTQEKIL